MWAMSTLTAVVLLFGYHTSTSGALRAESSQISAVPTISSAGRSNTTSTSTGTTNKTSHSKGMSTAATYNGDSVSTRWGPVQVRITVAGDQITGIDMLDYPYDNPRDQQINNHALPILIDETINAQSTQIDMVSGATYTSSGYLQSLQSALDQAGL